MSAGSAIHDIVESIATQKVQGHQQTTKEKLITFARIHGQWESHFTILYDILFHFFIPEYLIDNIKEKQFHLKWLQVEAILTAGMETGEIRSKDRAGLEDASLMLAEVLFSINLKADVYSNSLIEEFIELFYDWTLQNAEDLLAPVVEHDFKLF